MAELGFLVMAIGTVVAGLPGFLKGSFGGGIIGSVIGAVAMAVFAFYPLWGVALFAAAWIVSAMIGSAAARRRRREREHREIIAAIKSTQGHR